MKHLFTLLLLVIVFTNSSCDLFDKESVQADLTFRAWDNIYNPCLNYNEYLDTRNLYWVPVTNSSNWVLLYWRNGVNGYGFFDCYGAPWYILPGTTIVSYRYMENAEGSNEEADVAEGPSAQAYTTVVDPDGNSSTYEGPVVSFGDMAGGDAVQLNTTINISAYGTYINEYRADPADEIEERNETNNNLLDQDFGINGKSSRVASFVIQPLDEIESLRTTTEPYVVYENGIITRYNY